jgi:L-asparagine oxygenase
MGEDLTARPRPRVADDHGGSWLIQPLEGHAITLSNTERDHLADVAREIAHQHSSRPSGYHLDDSALMVDCSIAMHREAPITLLRALLEFRHHGNAEGALLLRNVPIDAELPITPRTGNYDGSWRVVEIASIIQLMVMNVLGDVISYADEKQGRIIQDVVPVQGSEHRQENSGTCLLELHTEDGFHPARPRFISLLGLRADHDREAWTLASGIRRALAGLDGGSRATLARPIFSIRIASSFVGDNKVFSAPMAVLQGSPSDPELCVDFHAMSSLYPEGERALANLRQALLSNLHGHVLEGGDMVVIDNDKAVHGRTNFSARADDADRWLRRCFAVPDLRRSIASRVPQSRVHVPIHSSEHPFASSLASERRDPAALTQGAFA